MIKMICCVSSATLGVLLLSACGSSAPVVQDKAKLSTGDNNAIATGGYWWTYTDHNTEMNTGNAGATVSPHTDKQTGLVPDVDSDAAHGKVIHATGSIPAAPTWADVTNMGLPTATGPGPNWVDTYWQALYPSSLVAGYPAAGIGFGFQNNNKPFDAVQDKYIGLVFDMKTAGNTNDIAVSVPIVGTDLANANFDDAFPKDGCIYPNKADPAATDSANFVATNAAQTCFGNYHKIFAMANRAANDVWQTYCVLWSELTPPSWVKATLPAMDHAHLKQALKVQWDMFQPPAGATEAAKFDVKLDNIRLVTEEDATKQSACDAAAISASATLIAAP